MFLFKRKKKQPLADASKMGFRDKLVLCKLGFDLRGYYERLVNEPLPDEFDASIKSLEAGASRRRRAGLISRLEDRQKKPS
jgi:hypothetical protein